jgi:glycosyltransferase involved in cell wall biosynthesis
MDEPLVSVVLPAYNAGAYIDQAMNSILRQSYRNIEIIAIDDGSTDKTLLRLKSLQSTDARIRVVSRENRGLTNTLNEGFDLARGQIVARMDADDIAYPNRLLKQVMCFASDDRLAMCGTHVDYLISPRRILSVPPPNASAEDIYVHNIFSVFFVHPTVAFRKSILDETGLRYDEKYPHAEDFELFRRISRSNRVAFLPEALLAFRTNHASIRSTKALEQSWTHYRIVLENLAYYGIVADADAFIEVMRPGHHITTEDQTHILQLVRSVGEGQQHFPRYLAAYERAFSGFLDHLFGSLMMRMEAQGVVSLFRKAGVYGKLHPRAKLMAGVSAIFRDETSKRADSLFQRAAQMARSRALPKDMQANV